MLICMLALKIICVNHAFKVVDYLQNGLPVKLQPSASKQRLYRMFIQAITLAGFSVTEVT